MLIRLVQPKNKESLTVVRPSGKDTLIRFEHPANALLPIFFTLLGILTLIKLLQYSKDWLPIVVILSGTDTLTKDEQPWNVPMFNTVNPVDILTLVIPEQL